MSFLFLSTGKYNTSFQYGYKCAKIIGFEIKKLEMLTNEKHSKEKLKFERGFANYIGSHYYAD